MDINSRAKKIADDMRRRLLHDIEKRYREEIEAVQYYIMDGYDWISMLVTDPNSKTNPYLYRDKFESKVKSFKYVERSANSVKFRTPDIDNFNLDDLPIVSQILNGTLGAYVEVSHEDMEKITGTTVINNKPIDPSVSNKDRVYLERYTNNIRAKERHVLKKKLTLFPFSNTPPLYGKVFGDAEDYVTTNIKSWASEAAAHSREVMMKSYQGVNI